MITFVRCERHVNVVVLTRGTKTYLRSRTRTVMRVSGQSLPAWRKTRAKGRTPSLPQRLVLALKLGLAGPAGDPTSRALRKGELTRTKAGGGGGLVLSIVPTRIGRRTARSTLNVSAAIGQLTAIFRDRRGIVLVCGLRQVQT